MCLFGQPYSLLSRKKKPFDKEKNEWYTLLQIDKKAMKRRVSSGAINREPWNAEKGKWS